jgi:hypothetical protein
MTIEGSGWSDRRRLLLEKRKELVPKPLETSANLIQDRRSEKPESQKKKGRSKKENGEKHK